MHLKTIKKLFIAAASLCLATTANADGCGGLKEISGEGDYAGMVRSICFNGVFNVPNFQTNFT
ncbi:MAG: hypothetical protein DRP64_18575, partial [Verrucomicrobia bacterium]